MKNRGMDDACNLAGRKVIFTEKAGKFFSQNQASILYDDVI